MNDKIMPKPQSMREYSDSEQSASEAAWMYFREYTREKPEVVVLWAFGIGFVLGWKLKPW